MKIVNVSRVTYFEQSLKWIVLYFSAHAIHTRPESRVSAETVRVTVIATTVVNNNIVESKFCEPIQTKSFDIKYTTASKKTVSSNRNQ